MNGKHRVKRSSLSTTTWTYIHLRKKNTSLGEGKGHPKTTWALSLFLHQKNYLELVFGFGWVGIFGILYLLLLFYDAHLGFTFLILL